MSKLKMLSTEHSADTPFAGRGIGHFNPVPGQGSSMVPLVGVRELKSLHDVRKKKQSWLSHSLGESLRPIF